MPRKQSFLERLTGSGNAPLSFEDRQKKTVAKNVPNSLGDPNDPWDFGATDMSDTDGDDYDDEGELGVDMYISNEEIVIQSMIAGVTPENLQISITRDIVFIRGKRIAPNVPNDEYAIKELYWGAFSRKIELPFEIDTDNAEAIEKYGLLIIRLPKLDISRSAELKVKSI